MKKRLSLVSAILCVLLLFASCDSNSNNDIPSSDPSDSSTEDTPIELSDFENDIYSILISQITTFNDPSSVKLISYNENFYEERILLLRISATNKLGATVTNDFVMVVDDFKVYDAYDYLDYYETGHMPAMNSAMIIPKGTVYSFEPWGDPYENETKNDDIPDEYFVLYQIVNYAIPEKTSTTVSVANINKKLSSYKAEMGW